MDFTNIPTYDIINFLKLNHKYINNTSLHNTAIQLINNVTEEIIFTQTIQNWLTAFTFKNTEINPCYASSINLNDYTMFDTNKENVIEILKFLHLYIDDIDSISLLPLDLKSLIMLECYNSNIHLINKSFNQLYKTNKNNHYYKTLLCHKLLQLHHYTDTFTVPVDTILNVLNPSGHILNFDITSHINELIHMVYRIDDKQIILTKNGNLFCIHNKITSKIIFPYPVIDIIYHHTFYLLSRGKVYYGEFKLLNMYSFDARTNLNKKHDMQKLPITNVITMKLCFGNLYFTKTNGNTYKYNDGFLHKN